MEHGRAQIPQPTGVAPEAGQPSLTLADDTISISAGSPARALQDQLSEKLSAEAVAANWSKRSTLIFVVGTCSAFWGAAYWAVSSLVGR
jgi:hypothetical protein